MSRAFVKEDAASEEVIVPPRAPLPPDNPNYVTPRGLELLEAELAQLQAERADLKPTEGEERGQARQLALVDGQLEALNERLASAEVVTPDPETDEVAFGVSVTVRVLNGKFAGEERRFTIVGVDEAGDDEALVAFTAPIAQTLLGCEVGDEGKLEVAGNTQRLEVVALSLSR